MHALGIALSGGGSRAVGFHRGTLRALHQLRLVPSIDVVSTVSGGSVFGAAWMCAIAAGRRTDAFLDSLVPVLRRGFIRDAISSWRVAKLLLPGYTRTHRLAEVFDERLLEHRAAGDLPLRPALCLNASVLNHGMPGRFSRGGFSCRLVGERSAAGSYPETPLPGRTLGFAVAASAAFPFGLPPVTLNAAELPPFQGSLAGHRRLHLTDGGVLENLGVERLLASGRFGARHIIVSDAGVADDAWAPSLRQRIASFGAYALTRQTLSRLLTVMNDKQNRTMRQYLLRRAGALNETDDDRRLWFVRIDQTWEGFFEGVPQARLRAIAGGGPCPREGARAEEIVSFLEGHGLDLTEARAHYDAARAARANRIGTNFTGLRDPDIEALERHAMWQVYACDRVYGSMAAPAGGSPAA